MIEELKRLQNHFRGQEDGKQMYKRQFTIDRKCKKGWKNEKQKCEKLIEKKIASDSNSGKIL